MADLQRLFDLADPRIRRIWDEKQTQLSTKLEYGLLGLTDYTAEILDSTFGLNSTTWFQVCQMR